MKWQTTGKNHATSTCGRYIVNWNDPKTQYMAVRLGKPRGNLWEGSVCLRVGTKQECVEACEGDANEVPERL